MSGLDDRLCSYVVLDMRKRRAARDVDGRFSVAARTAQHRAAMDLANPVTTSRTPVAGGGRMTGGGPSAAPAPVQPSA